MKLGLVWQPVTKYLNKKDLINNKVINDEQMRLTDGLLSVHS